MDQLKRADMRRDVAVAAPLLEKQPGQSGQPGPVRRPRRRSVLLLAVLAALLLLLALPLVAVRGACGQTGLRFAMPDAKGRPLPGAVGTETETETGMETGTGVNTPKRATSSAAAAATVLECFQVAQPVLTPEGAATSGGAVEHVAGSSSASGEPCTVTLMEHVFAYSYGTPYVGNFTPPSCEFNRVVMNFTVVSAGRQFDRLALMYFGDTEVWRTSTAEPVASPGIRWVYLKDMTEYLALWKTEQKIIFDLGNLISSVYTGTFNTTLTATFFMSDVDTGAAPPSDLIIPISARKGADNAGSYFSLPADNATNTIGFPRNANRAVLSISANGQANEEFWWSNVLQSGVDTFAATAGSFTGYSPFREVQLYIDGRLAGVQWPFPVIFTGGVVPSLHRPIVGIDAFDLREHEIDITPWLPLLSDGANHTFTIQVAGLDDDGSTSATLTETVASSWYVTGKIFVWLDDDPQAITTGSAPVVSSAAPAIRVSQTVITNSTGANETLYYSVAIARSFSVHATVSSQASSGTVGWSQQLSYGNEGAVTAYGYDQVNNFSLTGTDTATAAGKSVYSTTYSYPLYCNTTVAYSATNNLTLWANLVQGLDLAVSGAAVFPSGIEAFASNGKTGRSFTGGAALHTHLDGTAVYTAYGDNSKSSGFGSTQQTFEFGGLSSAGMLGATDSIPLYSRSVEAVNQTIVHDIEYIGTDEIASVSQASSSTSSTAAAATAAARVVDAFAQAPLVRNTGPRVFMGRGGLDPNVATGAQVTVEERAAMEQRPMRRDW